VFASSFFASFAMSPAVIAVEKELGNPRDPLLPLATDRQVDRRRVRLQVRRQALVEPGTSFLPTRFRCAPELPVITVGPSS
jgi:hypothetical protein